MERVLFYLRIFPGTEAEYDRRHAEIWPELRTQIRESGFRNMTGFRRGTDVWYYARGRARSRRPRSRSHGPKPRRTSAGTSSSATSSPRSRTTTASSLFYDEVFHTDGAAADGPMSAAC